VRFHDFHLDGYTVAERGRRIVMHLVYDYPGIPREESNIEFRGVALYNFVHPAGAIITDIEETTPDDVMTELGGTVTKWARLYGVNGWFNFIGSLEKTGDFSAVPMTPAFYGVAMSGGRATHCESQRLVIGAGGVQGGLGALGVGGGRA
jgi:hypothetical protein